MSPLFKKNAPDSGTKPDAGNDHDWLLPEDGRTQLTKVFQTLDKGVILSVFTRAGENDTYNEYMTRFIGDVAALSPKIEARFLDLEGEEAKERGVTHSPTLLVNPDDYGIRYVGAPLGEEGRSFVETLLRVSARKSGLSPASAEILAKLDGKRRVRVFVNPG